jgi:hypothetical protein
LGFDGSFTKFKGLQFRCCDDLIGLSQRNRVRLEELQQIARQDSAPVNEGKSREMTR